MVDCRFTPFDGSSDSDSDSQPENNGSMISNETKLLNDLDLSSREETVLYKANPFSIAKINAASRKYPASEKSALDASHRRINGMDIMDDPTLFKEPTLIPDSITYYPGIDQKPHDSPSRTSSVKRSHREAQIRDAYDFSPDADKDWSTLPARKKVKTRSDAIVPTIQTKKFRLPILSPTTQIQKTGMDAASARRVITFLPPPSKSTPKKSLEKKRNAYPSPTYSTFKSSSSPLPPNPHPLISNRCRQTSESDTPPYKPLSPPSSALQSFPPSTLIDLNGSQDEDHSDAHVAVNFSSIAQSYPAVKATRREVGCSLSHPSV
ncbi:hypothetical protein H0H93_014983 [Arthromyces matolae]|nr:hypothetical protein H0H93_014983 [Arthromyces matolae]